MLRRLLFAAVLLTAVPVLAQSQAGPRATRTPDVIFVPTPHEVVDDMLRLAAVRKGDVLYDLGSGDGRIPIAAAKTYGVRAVGIDIDPDRIAEARETRRRRAWPGWSISGSQICSSPISARPPW